MIPIAVVTAVILVCIAVVHGAWALGSTWPSVDEATLARTVVGRTGIKRMPPRLASAVVAALLVGLAVLALAVADVVRPPAPSWLVKLAGSATALVFMARGLVAYMPVWRRLLTEQPFARLDQTAYAPLCLALGTAFLILLLLR